MIIHRTRSLSVLSALTAFGAAAALGLFDVSAVAADSKVIDWKAASARVDALVAARFKSQPDLVVAPRADDAEFLRRAALDLTGVIPTEAETVKFLQDASPDKRAALVDALLASPKHAEHMKTWYSNLLVGASIRDKNMNRRTFNEWLQDQFSRNRPYNELVSDMITASGNSEENGAIGLVSSFERSAADAAGKTSRFFLGVQIQCAQCHDHPYDKRIKKDDFASFAAFFMTTTHRRNQVAGNNEISFDIMTYEKDEMMGMGPGRAKAKTAGAMMRPGAPLVLDPMKGPYPMGQIQDAKFLLGKTLKDVPGVNRRELLAKWMTSKNNEWFADAFANRLWGHFLGHGIVHPVDDFNNVNKPTNPELLKFLAEELVRGAFDINHLIRVILNSETYQRSSKNPRDVERPDASLFASGPIKPLTVEQSFDSFFRATGVEQEIQRRMGAAGMGGAGKGRGQMVDPKMLIYQMFRRAFDDDEAVESEEFTGTIPRGLLMMNGPQINQMVSAHAGSPLKAILDSERSDRERIRRIYLTSLSREPSPGELSNALQHVHTSRTESDGYEDLLWALLNTTEFMSNH